MIAPDTNLLLYAYTEHSPFHHASVAWLEAILSSTEPVGFPLPVLHSFLRLMTKPGIVGRSLDAGQVIAIVRSWLALPHVSILYPGALHWRLLQQIALQSHAAGDLLTDAAIAAIAQEHNAVIHSHDTDFSKFRDVIWHDPLNAANLR